MKTSSLGHVLVVGGSSGIGLATATELAQRGYRVTAAGRDRAKAEAAVVGTTITPTAVDGMSDVSVKALFASLGPVDHLVITLSGSKGAGPFASVSAEQLQEGLAAKLLAHWRIAQHALPTLSPTGSITFVSAISARGSLPGTAGLAAINGAIESLVRPLAKELKPRRVNAVSPGVIETPWWDRLPPDQRASLLASAAQATAVGRNGTAEEVAAAVVLLVTNAFITGTVIDVEGGLRLG